MAEVVILGKYPVLYGARPVPGQQEGADGVFYEDGSPPYLDNVLAPSAASRGVVTSNLPIGEVENRVAAQRRPTFLDDFYNRIHIQPSRLELGNLLSTQVRQVEVWSAYLEPQLLNAVTQVGTDGIQLTQPQAAPTYFAALETRVYVLNISTNGSPVIDATYTFDFQGENPTLRITGRRVVVWPFMPQTKHREGLEWKTDIIPSFKNEQRLALRAAPRQTFSFDFQLDNHQFSRAKAIATQWAHRVYGIPVWSELTRLGALPMGTSELQLDTTQADYRADDLVILWESDSKWVAVETTTVTPTSVALKLPLESSFMNAYVAPLRFARTPGGMEFRRSSNDIATAKATFLVTVNKDLGGSGSWPTYRGKDVMLERPVLVGDLTERLVRSTDEFDNGSGPVIVDIQNDWVTSTKMVTFDTLTRADRWAVRRWIHSRRGRQKAFWLPSWNPDLIMVENQGAQSTALTVRPISYPLYYGIKDIMVQLNDGRRFFRRVLNASVDPQGNEILNLDESFGTAFTIGEVAFICFMSHVRFNADKIDVSHASAGRATISIPVTETPE
ncbi:virion structural protein [Pseudomonas phage Epa19]|nr:virion structural protein [Pseudomonas phage Epa19]